LKIQRFKDWEIQRFKIQEFKDSKI